ncbi:MAG: GNAT family N-acetyltransferase [Phycisphaeraceae bacterium]|nr:GNAT family N-acetyltransferase [Phycisphaeraceae bacterium]
MDIGPYESRDLEAMAELYNRQALEEPHVAPMSGLMFEELVIAKSYFDPQGLLVAREGQEVLGWIHASVAPTTEIWQDARATFARICMLVYPVGKLELGLRLVERARDWLASQGHQTLMAFHSRQGYPFYRGLWMGGERMCPTTFVHLHAALSAGGFKATAESAFLRAQLDRRPREEQAAIAAEFVDEPLDMARKSTAESWRGFAPRTIKAMVGKDQAGIIGYVMQPQLTAKLGGPCVNIYLLATNPSYQRKGIAAALVSRAVAKGYELGARRATVGTQLGNVAAHRTYERFGFKPYRLSIGREWNAPEGGGE